MTTPCPHHERLEASLDRIEASILEIKVALEGLRAYNLGKQEAVAKVQNTRLRFSARWGTIVSWLALASSIVMSSLAFWR